MSSKPLALSRKEKVVVSVVISASVFAAGAVIVIAAVLLGSNVEVPDFYPDLDTQEGSTCWESHVFASTYDPVYKWITSSSIATSLRQGQDVVIPPEQATVAYQKASVWRVSSNIIKEKGNLLFNSPDPRILGGVIHQHSTNWIWKMSINWGLSVRLCLTGGSNADESCLWTTPVVAVEDEGNSTSLQILRVSVPYRRPSANSYNERQAYASHGGYLTNFASNARSNLSLGMNRRLKQGNKGKDWPYYYSSRKLNLCSKYLPINYTPDIVSYLAFPSLQCGCADGVCVVGLNLTGDSKSERMGPFEFNIPACQKFKSFWDWDSIPDAGTSIFLTTYSSKWDLPVILNVTFQRTTLDSISNVDNTTLGAMRATTLCVENWLESPTPINATSFPMHCTQDHLVLESILFERLEGAVYPGGVRDLVRAKLSKEQQEDKVSCGVEDGQAALEAGLCVQPLPELNILKHKLKSFVQVVDIHRYGEHVWEKGASQRSGVYVGIMTTLFTLLLTIAGMMSKKLQDAEDIVIHHIQKFRWLMGRGSMPVLRTLIRTGLILGATVSSLLSLYKSIGEIKSGPELATAGTILQSSKIMFLVTTTSTIQVSPNWIVFYALCSVLGAFIVVVVVYIYFVMLKLQDAPS